MGDFHQPIRLLKDYESNTKKVLESIDDGLPPKNAVMMVFGITSNQWYVWRKYVEEDLEDGFTEEDSPLIKLFMRMADHEEKLHQQLVSKAREMALDENTEMLKFLLERRFNYKKTSKNEVEHSTKEDTTFNINITNAEDKD